MFNLLLMISFTIHVIYSMKNGFPALPGEFNYIASIYKGNFHHCSGVIIHEQHIITAAHRIVKFAVEEMRAAVGIIAVSSRWAEWKTIKEVYLHPDFSKRSFIDQEDDSYFDHDIAVLKLEQSLIWSPFLSPVSLVHVENDWDHHVDCIIISWNPIYDTAEPLILNWELIKFMNNGVHQQWANYLGIYQKFFSHHFGTIAIGAEDLGSALICGNSMAGLIVEGEQSRIPGKPSIAMSIAPYLRFIDDIVHDGLFEVEHEKFPYAVAIWYHDIHVCGGFIVDDIHVATAGHCIRFYEIRSFTVAVGHPPQWFSLVDYAIHPDYKVRPIDVSSQFQIDNDFALLTLDKPIVWNPWTRPLQLAESDDFYRGQLCDVLRWKYHRVQETGKEFIKLMTSHVEILSNQCFVQQDPSFQSQDSSFWGISQYLIPIADHTDVGNPIICNGSPVGYLVQAIPFNGKTTALLAKFLKIRPYIEFRTG